MTRAIPSPRRLLPILVLGVVVSALTLGALVYLLRTTTRQRIERARDGVAREVERVARDPDVTREPYGSWVIGMRGGTWDDAASPDATPSAWRATIEAAVHASAASRARAIEDAEIGEGHLIVAAQPSVGGRIAWTGALVRALPSNTVWQWIVIGLGAATALLVAMSARAILAFQKGTARLSASLEEARAEEQRLAGELARQERLAALGRVVAGVAHEVRNPLASIKLRLDLAAANGGLPAIASDAIGNASSEIARLDRLVADLLVVAGRASGPRARASLGALVRQRAEAIAPWAAERGVAIDVEGDADAAAHVDAIARAVDNLLRNAVEASARDGRVRAIVSSRDHVARVAVEDRGEGVPAPRAPELFEPFFTTKPEGTGLGLAITRAIARQHGGDVTYAREHGVTRFELAIAAGEGRPEERAA